MKVTSGELTENSNSKLKTQSERQRIVSAKLSKVLSPLKQIGGYVLKRPALVTSLAVTALLLVSRQLNLLEPLELSAYDRLMQLRPALPPDPRLLIVKVTEADIQSLPYPLTDATMNQLLKNLEQYQPAVIGIDIYRDKQQPPGHAELANRLRNSDRIIPVCERRNVENRDVPPPPSVPMERVGFSDIPIDKPNGIVRRGLLFIPLAPSATSRCNTQLSFSFQLAYRYLQQKGINSDLIQRDDREYLKLGQVIFKPISPNTGGYQNGDTGGYQILLNYRSPVSPSPVVTLTDVLNNRIDPSLVKDRIILIGVTASSIDDAFYTPYSSAERRIQKMPGVMVHGQIVSQLLSAVLDGRPLFWFWPEWGEVLWIWGWTLTGGALVRFARHPGELVLIEGVALGVLVGTSVILFLGSGWVPIVAPILGLVASSTAVVTYKAYKAQKDYSEITKKVQEQEKNLALLQVLLKERTNDPPTTQPDGLPTEQTEMGTGDSTMAWDPQEASSPVVVRTGGHKEGAQLLTGRYKIIRVLGSGGFGLTYLAEDDHRPGAPRCVVKHLKPARQDEKFLHIARRLFHTEAEILEKLGHHAQIPQLLAYFEENKEFYLVQEYIQGHTLNEELPVDKRLPEAQVVDILRGVLEILAFIHKHSVIHRDIKPSNIIRREVDGKVVLIDFGAVKQIQPQEQTSQEGFTVAVGTRGYAPSEQYAGHPNFSSDIYALGMIGVQAVTGIPPQQLSVSGETGDISWRHLANVSEKLGDILQKMVRYHFPERYQSATEVLKELEGLKV